MIKFLVKGQNIETLEHEIIADNQVSFVNVHFVFDNNWKPLHKVVQFAQDEFVYNMVLQHYFKRVSLWIFSRKRKK